MTARAIATALILALLPVSMTGDPGGGPDATLTLSASRAYLDPETGRLGMPPPAQRQTDATRRAVAVPQASTVRVERRDGMTIVTPPESHRVYLKAEIDQNGAKRLFHEHVRR